MKNTAFQNLENQRIAHQEELDAMKIEKEKELATLKEYY